MVLVTDRPPEAEDGAVPGRWEGDVVSGAANRSQVGTLVERTRRFLMLVYLPGARGADAVADGIVAKIIELPGHLRRSLTSDQGTEMAKHARITIDTSSLIVIGNRAPRHARARRLKGTG